MNAAQLLEHFDRLSEAPGAVPRLRRFILDLAVRGKLVEQEAGDEPAGELLKRIQAEKARLIQAGEIGKEKPLLSIHVIDIPFAAPLGWLWTRFGALIHHSEAGLSPKTEGFSRSGNHWGVLKVSAVSWDRFKPEENKQLLPGPTPPDSVHVQAGDFLISRANTSALVAKCVIVEEKPEKLILSDKTVRLRITSLCYQRFLSFVNNHSLHAREYYASQASGTSDSMKNVSRPIIYGLLVPFPPLAEQHRIVAKVDELMALCDQLEAAQQERERRRDRLAAASLQRLNQPAADTTSETQRDHARFHLHHLPRLTTRPEHIKALRQIILNLAVRGLLVLQDANDEPATELLKRIQTEKTRLTKLGCIKSEKAAEPIDQIGWIVPGSWALCRWNRIAMKIGDIDHKMPDTVSVGVPYVSPRDFYPNNVIDFEGAKRISREDYLRLAAKIKPDLDDLIYPRYGTIGENRLVTEQREFLASYSCAVVKTLTGFIDPKYQYIFSISGYCKDQAKAAENKTTQANVGIASIQQYIVPLPPIAEQHRIVAKVDELMVLCDQLETQLSTTQTDSRRLLEAVLDAALVKSRDASIATS